VLPTGASAEVGGEPTTAANVDAGVGAAIKVDRWSRGGTPSGTSEEHYRMECTESLVELLPRHLVVCGASGCVVGPPCTGVPMQLLHDEEGLLHFGAAQEPELGLHHPKNFGL
jgi:hypothetical protein